jgi:CRISPR-associated endonuclease/helicase Cas3
MAKPMTVAEFFTLATQSESEPSGRTPYPFQARFATANPFPHLLRAPTGAGKTATAVLGWLWRYFHGFRGSTPRRLVYCLPMRVLVEQSYRETAKWLAALGLTEKVGLHLLMGGVESEKWFLHPEKPGVLIGTQDMLLSRALNRGFAASRFHWPIDFGLLNNDCLWVFDEPQLMAGGVSTSAQLAGFRQALGTFGGCPSVWMSATLEPGWLDTIDFKNKFPDPPLELDEKTDYSPELPLYKRMTAEKKLAKLNVAASKDGKEVAKVVLAKHEKGTQSLVIVNTVDRAKAVYDELAKQRKKAETPALLLVHSRFRPHERIPLNTELQRKDAGDRILVATQVVEAGVDISARTLVTELCPWASVVQRVGRCNRTGDDGPGKVFWIDLDEKLSAPYEADDLDTARGLLAKLENKGVSPKQLDDFKRVEKITLDFTHKHVLRRRDLLDLFDTAPDLSGNDIDVSRFVRSDDPDTDVQVFWRAWTGKPDDQPKPERNELCNVSLSKENREFFKAAAGDNEAFVWDHLEGEWAKLDPKQLRPGLVVMLQTTAGGYSEQCGWDAGSKSAITPYPPTHGETEEAAGSDPNSITPKPLTITMHTANVCRELDEVLKAISLSEWDERLRKAVRWHDAGKAHAAFQHGMRTANPHLSADQLWAKSGKDGKLIHGRKHFRHELASALAALQHNLPFTVAYLISSHHGRARLNIRSLPGEDEKLPAPPPELFALGVYQNDPLPAVDLGGETCPETTLDLTPMQLGGEKSWTYRALALLAELGPFKLAYLEALLRAVDQRASEKEKEAGGE